MLADSIEDASAFPVERADETASAAIVEGWTRTFPWYSDAGWRRETTERVPLVGFHLLREFRYFEASRMLFDYTRYRQESHP